MKPAGAADVSNVNVSRAGTAVAATGNFVDGTTDDHPGHGVGVHERDLQIIATTHSPVVLQWLHEETLQRPIIFGRVSEEEGTVARRLGDLPHFRETLKRKGIEDLFTTGWLEMAL